MAPGSPSFASSGVRRVLGIDGDYLNRDQLLIPADCFLAADLSNPPPIEERFDLAICLEVAEHLPAQHADRFIRFLTRLGARSLSSLPPSHIRVARIT